MPLAVWTAAFANNISTGTLKYIFVAYSYYIYNSMWPLFMYSTYTLGHLLIAWVFQFVRNTPVYSENG